MATTTKERTMDTTCTRCGTCGEPAEANAANEGYSNCCNDRIVYPGGEEYAALLRDLADPEWRNGPLADMTLYDLEGAMWDRSDEDVVAEFNRVRDLVRKVWSGAMADREAALRDELRSRRINPQAV